MFKSAQWVDSPAQLARVRAAIAHAGRVAFDLEFNSEERYVPALALIQLAWQGPGGELEVALCDPLAVDLRPLVEAMAEVTLVAHASRQDLQLLASHFQFRPTRLWDTQVAAAFCGFGEQIGYAKLAHAICGAVVDKGEQWTNWLRRPLSSAQLAYAAGDVRYLFAIADAQVKALGARSAWAAHESAVMSAVAYDHATLDPDDAWVDVTGVRGLSPKELAVLRRIAAWRMAHARAHNTPIGRVLSEKAMVELLRRPPRDAKGVTERAFGAIAARHGEAILDAISAGLRDAKDGRVPTKTREHEPPALAATANQPFARLWEELGLAVVGLVSRQTDIAARMLATRSDVEAVVRVASALPVADRTVAVIGGVYQQATCLGWRAEVIGAPLLALYRGEAALRLEAEDAVGGVRYA